MEGQANFIETVAYPATQLVAEACKLADAMEQATSLAQVLEVVEPGTFLKPQGSVTAHIVARTAASFRYIADRLEKAAEKLVTLTGEDVNLDDDPDVYSKQFLYGPYGHEHKAFVAALDDYIARQKLKAALEGQEAEDHDDGGETVHAPGVGHSY